MKKTYLNYFCTISCWLLLSCCSKDKNENPAIPPPSTTGANIMVYKVNGEQRVYTGTPNNMKVAGVTYSASKSTTDSSIYISGAETNKNTKITSR